MGGLRLVKPRPEQRKREHICEVDHNWPAIDAAMAAAGWAKRSEAERGEGANDEG